MTEGPAVQLAKSPDFQLRVTFSLMKNAKTFLTDGAPANVALAKLVRDNPESYSLRFAIMAFANLSAGALAAINANSDVAQASIDTQVVALWPSFAL